VLLSDRDIRAEIDGGRVVLEPYDKEMVQPSSVDVRIDRYFRLFDNHKYAVIDPALEQPELTRLVEVDSEEPFVLHPGEFVLASTYELVTLPDDVAARLEGKSSLGRLHRPRLLRARHPRAQQRRHPPHQALAGHEDRPAVLLPAV
jgi:dCTP deaminase